MILFSFKSINLLTSKKKYPPKGIHSTKPKPHKLRLNPNMAMTSWQ